MKYKALVLENEGNKQEETLLAALKQSDILNDCYAYKSRVKSEEKLLEKVDIKKAEGKKDYAIESITDVIGLRLITLFRVDMITIFEKVLNIINHSYDLTPNPFKKRSFDEIVFYTNRNNDKINPSLKGVTVGLEIEDKYEMKQRESEYSSIHIITRLNKSIKKLSSEGL